MYKLRHILFLILPLLLILPPTADSAILWDLIIETNMENEKISHGERPIIYGQVTDHAGKPVDDVQVRVRAGVETINLTTNENGLFKASLSNATRVSGIHVVNIMATAEDGRMGVISANFQVTGNPGVASATAQKLSTEQAKRFLNANPKEFEDDPIKSKIYEHYQKMYSKYVKEKQLEEKIQERQKELEKHRKVASNILQKKIEEKKPGAGTYKGWSYEKFVSSLNPSIKDIIVRQLNHTTNSFNEAQKAMEEVLTNGGNMKEARQAYFEKVSITRDSMNAFTIENLTSISHNGNTTENNQNKTKTQTSSNSTAIQNNSTKSIAANFNLKNATLQVEPDGKTIIVNINGSQLKFLLNGTNIYQIINTTK